MTTLAELVKAGKCNFVPKLESYGFEHHGKLQFSKVTGQGVHQLIRAELSYGENLIFLINCFVPEYNLKYMENYPSQIPIVTGGDLGEDLVCGELWEVDELDNIDEIYLDVIKNLEKYAFPWFERVQTRKDFFNELFPHLKEDLENSDNLQNVLEV